MVIILQKKIKLYYNNIIDDLNLEDLINKLNEELNNLFVKESIISFWRYLILNTYLSIILGKFWLDYKHISMQ